MQDKLIEKLINLIDVKTIITVILVCATVYFVSIKLLDAEIIKTLTLMAVSFYLGTKAKQANDSLAK
jgi:hypothetical protein